jgi:hypothetical protein
MNERLKLCVGVLLAVFVLLFCVEAASADWNPGDPNKMHFAQLPDLDGWDVNFKAPNVLADDFVCAETGAITDIHFWYSWRSDFVGQISNVHVSLHADVPAGTDGVPFSRPLNPPLWEYDFLPGQFQTRLYGSGPQGWFDPFTATVIEFDHNDVYQLNIVDIDQFTAPFIQQEGTIYWLDVSVTVQGAAEIGWKTADTSQYPEPYTGSHFQDDAVWGPQAAYPYWDHLNSPVAPFESLDLAFVITPEPTSIAMLLLMGSYLARSKRR